MDRTMMTEDQLWWKAALEGSMSHREVVEGHHSSYLEGLRKGQLDRAAHAVDEVRTVLDREQARKDTAWWRRQCVRWKAYALAHEAMADRRYSWAKEQIEILPFGDEVE